MTKLLASFLPAGMACALSESGDWTRSQEVADAEYEKARNIIRKI
jgi:hypothetical protein